MVGVPSIYDNESGIRLNVQYADNVRKIWSAITPDNSSTIVLDEHGGYSNAKIFNADADREKLDDLFSEGISSDNSKEFFDLFEKSDVTSEFGRTLGGVMSNVTKDLGLSSAGFSNMKRDTSFVRVHGTDAMVGLNKEGNYEMPEF